MPSRNQIRCNVCRAESDIHHENYMATHELAREAGWDIKLSCGWWMECPKCTTASEEVKLQTLLSHRSDTDND